MPLLQPNFYAEWRASFAPLALLRDEQIAPPELLLQAIWFHQRLLRDQLRLTDGRKVCVLHPGFWNHEAGPDFHGAVLQIEKEPARTGDVEIDLDASGWRGHGHHRNPAFENVLLHVIWDGKATGSTATLALKQVLDSTLTELALSLGGDRGQAFPQALMGQCCAPLRDLSKDRLAELLREAALVRFERKGTELAARSRQVGWEQALWEGLFRALGYKQNVWPMQRLGELRPELGNGDLTPLQWQARLFGVSGLLPMDVPRGPSPTNRYIADLWNLWWRERDQLSHLILPRQIWKFHGIRPANHPQRRLALIAHWLANPALLLKLKNWFVESSTERDPTRALLAALQVSNDKFWVSHWTLKSKKLNAPQPLLGASRVTDLSINVLLPWFWVRARQGRNKTLEALAVTQFLRWPAGQDNVVERLARQRLLGSGERRAVKHAAEQQGFLQIVRDFCEHSDALCTNCPFPALVRRWR